MKTLLTISLLVASTTLGFAQAHNQPCDRQGKVLVCHIPPGNPENIQEICISENGVAAHLAHGCFVGTCQQDDTKLINDLEEFAEMEFVTVYPNPFDNMLTIEMVFADVTMTDVQVYDMKGTLVARPFSGLSESSFIMEYNTDMLSTGMYVVRVVTPNNVRTFKLSKGA